MSSQYLTLEATAERLGIGISTLYKHIAEGVFPSPVRIGGAVRVPLQVLEEWEAEQQRAALWAQYRKALPHRNGTAARVGAKLGFSSAEVELHRSVLREHARAREAAADLERANAAREKINERNPVACGLLDSDLQAQQQAAYTRWAQANHAAREVQACEFAFPDLFGVEPVADSLARDARGYLPLTVRNQLHQLETEKAAESPAES